MSRLSCRFSSYVIGFALSSSSLSNANTLAAVATGVAFFLLVFPVLPFAAAAALPLFPAEDGGDDTVSWAGGAAVADFGGRPTLPPPPAVDLVGGGVSTFGLWSDGVDWGPARTGGWTLSTGEAFS